jgi:hypothetical protein
MAYAKLTFSSTATVQQKLKDIAKVCTGAATTVADFEFAVQGASEIVTTEPAGWTMADAASALETSGTSTINEYRLQSPCVNNSKIKYCALTVYASNSATPGAGATIQNTRPAAAATTGHLWAPIGTGVSANALQNPGFVAAQFYNTQGTARIMTVSNRIPLGTATEIFISVTNRKLILFTFTSAVSYIIMNLEFPETLHTNSNNNLPLINITADSFTDTNSVGTITNGNTAVITANANAELVKSAYLANWFSAITRTRSNTLADDGLQLHWLPTVPAATISSAGVPLFPLLPIIDVRTTIGEGVHDYSALTETYQSFKTSAYNMYGDEFAYLSNTYVFFTIGANRIIAVKKA